MNELKHLVLCNRFVDNLRSHMKFDQYEFTNLKTLLGQLSRELRGQLYIDRELMLTLYSIPLVTRNVYLALERERIENSIVRQLEDAWVELDDLVTRCLYDPSGAVQAD